jgi:uncharacterized membrane protein
MTASTALFLLIRTAHVLLATIWVGAVALNTLFIFPALQEAGPSAGPVMGALLRRKLPTYMASLGGITVVTGFYLYYRFTGGFDPALSGSSGAIVFGTGGISGLLALIIGGAVVSRSAKTMGELAARLPSAPESERAAIAARMAAARERAATWSRIVLVLQAIAVVLMAIGHYV